MNRSAVADARALTLALLAATLVIAQQVAGRATRDALFLSHFEATALPRVVAASAVLSLLVVLGLSRLLARHGPNPLVPWILFLSATLLLGGWWLMAHLPAMVAVALYLHMAVFGAVLVSGFWSVLNERFDPHTARRSFARIGAAATLGGVMGAFVAERVAAVSSLETMLPVLAALHLACAGALLGLRLPRSDTITVTPAGYASGTGLIARVPYLRRMAALAVLAAAAAALLDYALKAEAAARFETGDELIAFFATFYAAVGVGGFLLQSLLGPRLLARYGIGAGLALLPLVVLAGAAGTAAIGTLWSVALLRGAHAVVGNSLFRAAFELLYTPLPPGQKRSTKTLIDVACDRLGDLLGAGLVFVLIALLAAPPTALVVTLAGLAAGLALWMVAHLNRGYVEQLARSLRRGAVSLSSEEVIDGTTRHVLAETSALAERELLAVRIREQRERHGKPRRPATPDPDEAEDEVEAPALPAGGLLAPSADPPSPAQRLGRAIADLTSGDAGRIRRTLRGDFMDLRMVPTLLPLLADDRVATDTRMELRWLVPRIIGQLTDALVDPDQPVEVRQRIPGILEVCHNPRVVAGLLEGLDDGAINVRHSCTRALARMRTRDPQLAVPEGPVLLAVRRELASDGAKWHRRGLAAAGPLGKAPVGDPELGEGSSLGMTQVFALLALVLDRDALARSQEALSGPDPHLRGTALEYLDHVLPEDIRASLWNRLGVGPPRVREPASSPGPGPRPGEV